MPALPRERGVLRKREPSGPPEPAADPDGPPRAASSLRGKAVEAMLRAEVGCVFEQVLHDSAVFKRDAEGMSAFDRFAVGL